MRDGSESAVIELMRLWRDYRFRFVRKKLPIEEQIYRLRLARKELLIEKRITGWGEDYRLRLARKKLPIEEKITGWSLYGKGYRVKFRLQVLASKVSLKGFSEQSFAQRFVQRRLGPGTCWVVGDVLWSLHYKALHNSNLYNQPGYFPSCRWM